MGIWLYILSCNISTMPQSSPQYYLNKYHEQIVRAIKLSKRDCVEYAYVKPATGSAFQIKGMRTGVIIPKRAVYNNMFVFHTHPYYMCNSSLPRQLYYKYISIELGGSFSTEDVQAARNTFSGAEILATFIDENTANLKGYNPLALNNTQVAYYRLIKTIFLTELGKAVGANYSWIKNPELIQAGEEVREFEDKYMPILETIQI